MGKHSSTADVEAVVQHVDEAARQVWVQCEAEVGEAVYSLLRAAAIDAARVHKELVMRNEGRLLYRRFVTDLVLTPFADALEAAGGSEVIGRAFESAMGTLGELPEQAEDVILPVHKALYDTQPGDSWPRTLIKGYHRVVWRLRRSVPTRTVPLRALVHFHVHMRLPEALELWHAQLQRHLAHCMHRWEAALGEWIRTVLQLGEDVQAAGQYLQNTLDAFADALTLPGPGSVSTAHQEFERHVGCAGTPLLSARRYALPPRKRWPWHRLAASRRRWASWHAQLMDRCAFYVALIRLKEAWEGVQGSLLERVERRALHPLQAALSGARRLLETTVEQVAQALAEPSRALRQDAMVSRRTHTLNALRERLGRLAGLLQTEEVLARAGQEVVATLTAAAHKVPAEILVHAVPRATRTAGPEQPAWMLHPRQIIQRSVQSVAARVDRPAHILQDTLVRIWGDSEQAIQIVAFSLHAALGEIETSAEEELATARAEELCREGCRRADEVLAGLEEMAQAAWDTFAQAVRVQLDEGWSLAYHSARAAAQYEERWTGPPRWVQAQVQGAGRWLWQRMRRAAHHVRRLLRKGRRTAQQLVEQSRTAMEVGEASVAEQVRVVGPLAPHATARLQASLPLVYQRLFALQPVVEPMLLGTRLAEAQAVQNHAVSWQAARDAGVLVVSMTPGSGRTSLLQGIREALADDFDVHRVSLAHRVSEEAALSKILGRALGAQGESLDEVARALAVKSGKPRVCLVDDLEHLLLRAHGGSDLLRQVLPFFARTSEHLFWVCTVSNMAWRYLDQAQPRLAGLVSVLRPRDPDRDALQRIILKRHRFSGLQLHYAEPAHASTLQWRRLRQAKTAAAAQAVRRDIFFSRLYQHAGANIMLGLYYWIRSARFDGRQVTVGPMDPVDFRFFQSFSMERAAILQALLFHKTLTVAEHSRVFRVPVAESSAMLESMLRLHLVIMTSGGRYRLNPLVFFPVLRLLRERNLLPKP